MKLWWWSVDWLRYLAGRETRDEAWIDGYRQSEVDGEQYLADKEAWITQCEEAIKVLLETCMVEDNWEYLRDHEPELYDWLGAWA